MEVHKVFLDSGMCEGGFAGDDTPRAESFFVMFAHGWEELHPDFPEWSRSVVVMVLFVPVPHIPEQIVDLVADPVLQVMERIQEQRVLVLMQHRSNSPCRT